MPLLEQMTIRNRLLQGLAREDFALLGPHLRPVTTALRQVLVAPGERIREVFFPEVGFASITYGEVEIGLIGREGLVGAAPVLLGIDRTPYAHFVQMPGTMLSLDVGALRQCLASSASLHRALVRFVQAHLVQASHTAYANASHSNEVRLARWLLMCHDRVDGDEIRITHEFLAMMLGVQRTGVTMALQALQANALVRGQRGSITILRRDELVTLAGDSYGVPEEACKELLGAA